MNTAYASILAASLAAFSAGHAFAADASASKTREQVRAELAEAQRTGNIIHGEAGQRLNEVHPGRYPAKTATPGKTREEVRADLAEAVRTGNIISGETSRTLKELFPGRYAEKPVVQQGKTRAQVRAELQDAQRNGQLPVYVGA